MITNAKEKVQKVQKVKKNTQTPVPVKKESVNVVNQISTPLMNGEILTSVSGAWFCDECDDVKTHRIYKGFAQCLPCGCVTIIGEPEKNNIIVKEEKVEVIYKYNYLFMI